MRNATTVGRWIFSMMILGAVAAAMAGPGPRAQGVGKGRGEARGGGLTATAEIRGCQDPAISGSATLREKASTEGVKLVEVELRVKGMKPGIHAVHIHEVGRCEPCGEAKGHFDPGPAGNSSPDGNHPFHLGDLVNLSVGPSGEGHLKAATTRITLSPGPLSVLDDDGSAFIIHVDPDTYCPEGETKGCAGGARAACGVIRMP